MIRVRHLHAGPELGLAEVHRHATDPVADVMAVAALDKPKLLLHLQAIGEGVVVRVRFQPSSTEAEPSTTIMWVPTDVDRCQLEANDVGWGPTDVGCRPTDFGWGPTPGGTWVAISDTDGYSTKLEVAPRFFSFFVR